MKEERSRFEDWARREGYPIELEGDGETYQDVRTHAAWWSWQSAIETNDEYLGGEKKELAFRIDRITFEDGSLYWMVTSPIVRGLVIGGHDLDKILSDITPSCQMLGELNDQNN